MLQNLESWLNKAEQYADAKKFDVGVLMISSLAPDMKPFIYQVQKRLRLCQGGGVLALRADTTQARGQRADDR